MKIYVITHKKYSMPKERIYIPLQVGAAISNEDYGYLRDDTGENISNKNLSYCELTGIYWIWKNSREDIVGITHYRRHFFKNLLTNDLKKVLKKEDFVNILNKYEMIVPQKYIMKKYTVRQEYEKGHYKKDLDNVEDIIEKIYPDYINAFENVMNSHNYYQWNMFITNKKIFDEYAEWLFNILFELEKITDISSYDNYNKRIYGFLAERLFNVWIKKNNIKVKEIPVVRIDENKIILYNKAIKNFIKKILGKGK